MKRTKKHSKQSGRKKEQSHSAEEGKEVQDNSSLLPDMSAYLEALANCISILQYNKEE